MAGHLNLCREKANILLLRDKIECLPDSDPSEGLGLVLSDGESPLSGFRLKPEIKILVLIIILLHYQCTLMIWFSVTSFTKQFKDHKI